jgi:hypothetical protein
MFDLSWIGFAAVGLFAGLRFGLLELALVGAGVAFR